MKKSTRILLLAFTLLPFVQMFIFFGFIFKVMLSPPPRDFDVPGSYPGDVLSLIWLLVMSVFYIVHILKNRRLSKGLKVFWAIFVVLANMFIMPVYWYVYVWREDSPI